MRPPQALALLVPVLSLLACGPVASSSSGSPGTGGSTSASTPPPSSTPAVTGLTLRIADTGRTVHVRLGTPVAIDTTSSASPAMIWSTVSSSNPAVLQPVCVAASPLAGQPDSTVCAGFTASAAGTADLTATISPACGRSVPPCMAPSLLWRVTVIVDP